MLVVISDIHLCDGSAAPNVSAASFAQWLDEVLRLAEINQAEEIVFLYLGDIFDLLRTEHWFYPAPGEPLAPNPALRGADKTERFPLEDRPWGARDINERAGAPSAGCALRAREIMTRTREECRDALAILSGRTSDLTPAFVEAHPTLVARLREALSRARVRRHYIPGNHDRLYLHDGELARQMLDALGASAVPAPSGGPHAFKSAEYGVIARHGHEWDVWNFEAYAHARELETVEPEGYKLVPIGDPITTELVARLPYAMHLAMSRDPRTEHLADGIYRRLMQIEDVRPLHAAFHWVVEQGRRMESEYDHGELVRAGLEQVLRETTARFMDIPFVRAWIERHDRFGLGVDEADKLQHLDRALRLLNLRQIETLLAIGEVLERFGDGDECSRGASAEQLLGEAGDPRIRYCVYGHTHNFRHEPLSCDARGNERVYFNSGTWRPRVVRTRDARGFVGYKDIAYLVFYGEREDRDPEGRAKGTSYEAWYGLMLKRPR